MAFSFSIRWLIAISLFIHIITAVNSAGFYNFDEHFQILEFLNYKLGNIAPQNLAWEFRDKIRPGLPVAVAYGVQSICSFVGITDKFLWLMLFRVALGLLGWSATLALVLNSKDWFSEAGHKIFTLLAFGLWCLPFMHVRPSSEGMSLTALTFAIAFLSKNRGWSILLSGFALGIAFQMRFQTGIMIAGLGAWLIVFDKYWLKKALLLGSGFVGATALGLWADAWVYGEFVFAPLRYIQSNLIEGKAATFSVDPWWAYFAMVVRRSLPPFGIFFILVTFAGFYYARKHVLTWMCLPFLVVHIILIHKEYRFLFPLLLGLPFYLALFFEQYIATSWWQSKTRRVGCVFVWLFAAANGVGLIWLALVPAKSAVFLYKWVCNEKIPALIITGKNPYEMVNLPLSYYLPDGFKVIKFSGDLRNLVGLNAKDAYVFSEKLSFPELIAAADFSCHRVYSAYPLWLPESLPFGLRPSHLWTVFRCSSI